MIPSLDMGRYLARAGQCTTKVRTILWLRGNELPLGPTERDVFVGCGNFRRQLKGRLDVMCIMTKFML